jgi:DNA-binding transcriptional LysR family regulator
VGEQFRLGFVPGTTPAKWASRFKDRFGRGSLELINTTDAEAPALLQGHDLDAALMRLPVDREVFHAIPLYRESVSVVVPKDNEVTLMDKLTASQLEELASTDGDQVFIPDDVALTGVPVTQSGPATSAEAVEWVAAGAGLAVLPGPVARFYSRRDVASVQLSDVEGAEVGLVWLQEYESDMMEELTGIVRGRTANSSRSSTKPPPPKKKVELRRGVNATHHRRTARNRTS